MFWNGGIMAAVFMEFSILFRIIIIIITYSLFIHLLFYPLFKPRGLNNIDIQPMLIVHHELYIGNYLDFRMRLLLQNLSVSFYFCLFVFAYTVNMGCVCVFVCFCID